MDSEKRLSLSIARKFLITNSFLQEELLRQQQDFREVHQQDLIKMKKLQKFQNSTFDEFTKQKFIEDQKIIMEFIWKTSRTTE